MAFVDFISGLKSKGKQPRSIENYVETDSYGSTIAVLRAEALGDNHVSSCTEVAAAILLAEMVNLEKYGNEPPKRLHKLAFALIEKLALAGVSKDFRQKLMADANFLAEMGVFVACLMEEFGNLSVLYVESADSLSWREGLILSDQRFKLSRAVPSAMPIKEYLFWHYAEEVEDERLAEWTGIPATDQESLRKTLILFLRERFCERLPEYERSVKGRNISAMEIHFPYVKKIYKNGNMEWKRI